jgi:hypothetical protein
VSRWLTGLGELGRSLFALTQGERKALCLVLVLALLGLGVKTWHAGSPPQQPATRQHNN